MHLGSWLDEHLYHLMDNGEETSFWKDPWLKESSLIVMFHFIFGLSSDRNTNAVNTRRSVCQAEGFS